MSTQNITISIATTEPNCGYAFQAEKNSNNRPYVEALERDIATFGLRFTFYAPRFSRA